VRHLENHGHGSNLVARKYRRIGCALVCAGLLASSALAFGVTSASASSLVFIKENNIWLANPDGSGQYQVTLDGTAENPYFSPSQADDGTIVAARYVPGGLGREGMLFRMHQNGQLLNPPFGTESPLGNVEDPRVSPDGNVVVYTYVTIVGFYNTVSALQFTYADHLGNPPGTNRVEEGETPSWMSNSRIVMLSKGYPGQVLTYDIGAGRADWFTECEYEACEVSVREPSYPVVSRNGTRMAIVRQGDKSLTPPAPDLIALFLTNGGPPTKPTIECELEGPTGGTFLTPTWSPDGQSLAWAEGDGIHSAVITALDPNGECSSEIQGGGLLIAGGSEPNWGPADVNPGPRAGTGGGGSGGTGNGGSGGTSGTGTGTGQGAGGTAKADIFAGTAILGQTDVVRNGVARVSESCPAGTPGGSCIGTLTLASANPVAGQTAARKRRKHSAAKIVALGSASFSIPAGQRRSVAVRLTAQGLKLLAKHGTLAAVATAITHDGLGTTTTSKGRVTLKTAGKGKRRP
jgi:WD40-like Beta Propeller Repeat